MKKLKTYPKWVIKIMLSIAATIIIGLTITVIALFPVVLIVASFSFVFYQLGDMLYYLLVANEVWWD